MDIVDDVCSVYVKTWPRARKPTTCHACGERVPIGARYMRLGYLHDGAWGTVRRCRRCEAIHAHLVTLADRDGGSWPNELLDCDHTYEDAHGCEPPAEIAALAFALPGDDPPDQANLP